MTDLECGFSVGDSQRKKVFCRALNWVFQTSLHLSILPNLDVEKISETLSFRNTVTSAQSTEYKYAVCRLYITLHYSGCQEDRARLFSVVPSHRIRGNRHKLETQDVSSEYEKELLYFEGENTGTGCPERLWSVYPWRYSKASSTLPEPSNAVEPVSCRETGLSPEVPSSLPSCLILSSKLNTYLLL